MSEIRVRSRLLVPCRSPITHSPLHKVYQEPVPYPQGVPYGQNRYKARGLIENLLPMLLSGVMGVGAGFLTLL